MHNLKDTVDLLPQNTMASTSVTTPAPSIDPTVRMRISSRDDIKRDIQEWAKPTRRGSEDGPDEDQAIMIGGQIKDNVTEQRMLESRLFDLSRERYKFMVQVAWQRKAFLDKQKRKTSMMKGLLTGVDTTTVQAGKKNQSERLQEKTDNYKKLIDSSYGEVSRKRKQRKHGVKSGDGLDSDSLLERKLIFPKPITTASFAKKRQIFKTEVPKPSHKLPTDKTRGFPLDKRKVVFPSIQDGGPNHRRPSLVPEGGSTRPSPLPGSRTNHRPSLLPDGGSTRPSPLPGSRTNHRRPNTLPEGGNMIDGRQSVPLNFMRRDVQRQNSGLSRPRTEMNTRHSVSAGSSPRFLKFRASYDTRFSKLERLLTIPYDGTEVQVSAGVDDMSSLLKQLPVPTTPIPTISATPLPS